MKHLQCALTVILLFSVNLNLTGKELPEPVRKAVTDLVSGDKGKPAGWQEEFLKELQENGRELPPAAFLLSARYLKDESLPDDPSAAASDFLKTVRNADISLRRGVPPNQAGLKIRHEWKLTRAEEKKAAASEAPRGNGRQEEKADSRAERHREMRERRERERDLSPGGKDREKSKPDWALSRPEQEKPGSHPGKPEIPGPDTPEAPDEPEQPGEREQEE